MTENLQLIWLISLGLIVCGHLLLTLKLLVTLPHIWLKSECQ